LHPIADIEGDINFRRDGPIAEVVIALQTDFVGVA
jgi:hypothetical protein